MNKAKAGALGKWESLMKGPGNAGRKTWSPENTTEFLDNFVKALYKYGSI